jgi:hypothetical protein
MRQWGIAALVAASMLAVVGPAKAQPGTFRPPLSPYLNLLRGGNPAINYYGLVRPEQQFTQSIQQLQMQATAGPVAAPLEGVQTLPYTGHPVRFVNYSHYYNFYGQNPIMGSGTVYNANIANTLPGVRPPTINAAPFVGVGAGVGFRRF